MTMNKYTRFRENPEKIFDCYCEVSIRIKTEPNGNVVKKPWIKRRFPHSYTCKEVLESVPKFAFPCNNLVIDNITQFSFVLTNIDSKWTFAYCRISPSNDTCIVILTQLPWHETFFKIISHIGAIYNNEQKQFELTNFLKSLYQLKIPDYLTRVNLAIITSFGTTNNNSNDSQDNDYDQPPNALVVKFKTSPEDTRDRKLVFEVPEYYYAGLPTVPQDINLTEYYNAVNVENMITLFASAINERHILVTSKKLDRLSACVQAINTLLYPMNWQHIFIPILPSDLLAYLQAPMPFLIGVPEPTFRNLKLDELSETVILYADDNVLKTPHDDVKNLPPGIASSIRNHLRSQVGLGDSLSQAFLKVLVVLIGGYREALEFKDGERITFNHDRFIATRDFTYQPFLKKMLELQMFRQFIEGRLEMLNAGRGFNDDFEFGVNIYEESRNSKKVNIQYQHWIKSMKTNSGLFLRSINPSLKLVYKGLKHKSVQAYKDWKVKLNEANMANNNNNTHSSGNSSNPNYSDNNQSSCGQSSGAPSFLYSRLD